MTFKKPMLFATLCASLSILTLSCASPTPTGGTDAMTGSHADFCQVAKAISYSSRDTAQTREEIAEHNCIGHVLCGWKTEAQTCPAVP